MKQVIDYAIHTPIMTYLSRHFSDHPFSAIIDTVGIQDLFTHSPNILASSKPFVSVGPKASSYTYSAVLLTLILMAKNFLLPQILGGVPRNYRQVTGLVNQEALQILRGMAEEGKLSVHVGTLVEMEDVQQVGYSTCG